MTAKAAEEKVTSAKSTEKKSKATSKKSAAVESVATLRITLVRSFIGRPADQEATVRSLGLRKIHQTVERPDTPDVRGMINKVRHMVIVEEAVS